MIYKWKSKTFECIELQMIEFMTMNGLSIKNEVNYANVSEFAHSSSFEFKEFWTHIYNIWRILSSSNIWRVLEIVGTKGWT